MFPAASTAICGVNEKSVLLDTFFGPENCCDRAGPHITDNPTITIAAM